MASVREHLRKAHERMAEHHIAMAKLHKGAMGKAQMESEDDDFHQGAADQHTEAAEYHLDCCKDLMASAKARDGDELDKVMPLGVSAVAPDNPRLRMIPRTGAPDAPTAPPVDEQFSKLFSIGDDNGIDGV